MIEYARHRRTRNPRPLVLVGIDAFNLLKRVQSEMREPRLEFRYIVEGSIELLCAQSHNLQRWLSAAREALKRDLGGYAAVACVQASANQPCEAIEAVRDGGTHGFASGAGDITVAATRTDGHPVVEGAVASAEARAHAQLASTTRRTDCKSILLSRQAFDHLRAIQGRTQHPRLELRYLVDGAITLLHEDVASHAAWVQQSRQALSAHLSQELQQQPQPVRI